MIKFNRKVIPTSMDSVMKIISRWKKRNGNYYKSFYTTSIYLIHVHNYYFQLAPQQHYICEKNTCQTDHTTNCYMTFEKRKINKTQQKPSELPPNKTNFSAIRSKITFLVTMSITLQKMGV